MQQFVLLIAYNCICLFSINLNYNGHFGDLKKSHQIILGKEFDSFPEFYHLPQRHANIPLFGSKFNIISAKHKHVLTTWSEHKDNGHGYVSSHTQITNDLNKNHESISSIWTIEPGFHKHSVVIKDHFDRKLGIDHVNDSFNNMDIILMKTVTHTSSYSWFIQTNKYGNHNGLIFESMKHKYILSIDTNGKPYAIHKSLRHKDIDGWTFKDINYSDYQQHEKLLKNAKDKWHDHVLHL